MSYRERPEWSYSDMKAILEHDIDYAVAVKHKLLKQDFGKANDIGTLAHEELLKQGGSNSFVVKAYPDFRTKEAKEWRDAQTLPIISEEEIEQINKICEAVKKNIHSIRPCFVERVSRMKLNSMPRLMVLRLKVKLMQFAGMKMEVLLIQI